MELRSVPRGGTVLLAAPAGEARYALRMAALGLRPGVRVTVLQRTSGGGRILAVGDARIAVDGPTLRHLVVDPQRAAR